MNKFVVDFRDLKRLKKTYSDQDVLIFSIFTCKSLST
jgi:hypothetical protein